MKTSTDIFKDKLFDKTGGSIELASEYLGSSKPATFHHKDCGHTWETRPNLILRAKGLGCAKCKYANARLTHEEFSSNIAKRYKGDIVIMDTVRYVSGNTKMHFIHSKCGKESLEVASKLYKTGTCHHCKGNSGTRIGTTANFIVKLRETYNGEYELSPESEYTGAHNKVTITHTTCGHTWDVRASHILHTSGCPMCNLSKGEKIIKEILDELGCSYKREVLMEGCKSSRLLPFDFGIYSEDGSLLYLVEYDGEQHFQAFDHFGGQRKLESTQRNDTIKNTYCESNGITLIRFKYTDSTQHINTTLNTFLQEK